MAFVAGLDGLLDGIVIDIPMAKAFLQPQGSELSSYKEFEITPNGFGAISKSPPVRSKIYEALLNVLSASMGIEPGPKNWEFPWHHLLHI